MLFDLDTKQAIVGEMSRRQGWSDGTRQIVGMFVVPPAPNWVDARVIDFIRRFQATGFHFKGALQAVTVFSKA